MYLYSAYGLGIYSEFCFPELLIEQRAVDIEIRQKKLDIGFNSITEDEEGFWVNGLEVLRFVPNIGSFLIRGGREIFVDPASGVNEQLLRLCLLGNILGTLLHQRGMLVLHGSSINVNGEAIAFLGPSGSGKSTIAASLRKRGYCIVTDDVVAIDANGCTPLVYPALPQLKLWPDVAESLGYDLTASKCVILAEGKCIASFSNGFSSDPVPLKKIYLLEKHMTLAIMRLEPRESLIELVRNSYVCESLKTGGKLAPHFTQCANVVKNVPICRLARPFDLQSLEELAGAIEEDIRYGSSVSQNDK